MIKCVLIDVDTVLISEVVELDAEIGDPNCKLVNPNFYLKQVNREFSKNSGSGN